MPASTWPNSRIPFIDESGDPMVGAQLYFYDEGTTTPQTVYADASLSTPLDQPVEADARGAFPMIYFSTTPGSYRQRLLESDGTLVFDDDEIAVSQLATYEAPDAGETSETLLFRTGMRIGYYGLSAPSGWVRANGRSIGNASSGANERANADCESLFLHLWTADANLAVSGGRGASAAGDWAANKNIALPSYRDRVAVGMPAMGNSDAGLIGDTLLAAALGSVGGSATQDLTVAQLPAHNHTASFTGAPLPTHEHTINGGAEENGDGKINRNGGSNSGSADTNAVSAGTPAGTVTVNNNGSGEAHPNLQPSITELMIIKL